MLSVIAFGRTTQPSQAPSQARSRSRYVLRQKTLTSDGIGTAGAGNGNVLGGTATAAPAQVSHAVVS